MELKHDRLLKVLFYNEDTGDFIRKSTGATAGSFMTGGYRRIRLDGKVYLAHRLAWFYVYKKFPDGEIDHINRNQSDNRISNLREVSHEENSQNRLSNQNNKTGFQGVYFNKKLGKWYSK